MANRRVKRKGEWERKVKLDHMTYSKGLQFRTKQVINLFLLLGRGKLTLSHKAVPCREKRATTRSVAIQLSKIHKISNLIALWSTSTPLLLMHTLTVLGCSGVLKHTTGWEQSRATGFSEDEKQWGAELLRRRNSEEKSGVSTCYASTVQNHAKKKKAFK